MGALEEARDGEGARRVPRPVHAFFLLGGVAVLSVLGVPALGAALGLEGGLVVAEWLLMFAPAVAFVLAFRFDPVRTLSLRRPTSRQLTGALLLIAGGTPVAWYLAWLQSLVVPVPEELVEALERVARADSPGRLLWLLFLAAITPAFAEEFLFRGVLLGSTREAMRPWRAIALNAAIFALFHLSPVRLLPTAWLGFLLAWTVWRTGSIWTSVAMHAVNNGAVVLLASLPAPPEWTAETTEAPPWLLAPFALWLLFAGFRRLREPDAGG